MPASSRRRLGRRIGLIALALFLFGLIGATAAVGYYAWQLNDVVRTQFEGKRWSVPAKVYARPLELTPGMALSAEQLEQELKLLGYQTGGKLETGAYVRAGNQIEAVTRPFTFSDGREAAVAFKARFSGGQLASLEQGRTAEALPLVRLDPMPIAGIYPGHTEDRILVRIKDVPKLLTQTLVAVEDRHFYEHHGVDPMGLVRAMWANVRAGGLVQGGSTLTQQLVKNFYLTSERRLSRKFKEAVMAVLLETHYTKDEILEAYLNEIYLAQDGKRSIHGFGLASQYYFGRPVDTLDLPRIALLVGMAKGPSYYDPRRNPERARERRNLVLDVLTQEGVISAQEAAAAKRAALGVTSWSNSGVTSYPAFIDMVRRQLQQDYHEDDLRSEGLQIFTTLDPRAQRAAEEALQKRLEQLEKARGKRGGDLEGAVVITAVDTGEILAVVGGQNPRYAGFNRAATAERPIGSLIKPAIYLAALTHPDRYNLATLLDDGPLEMEAQPGQLWQPANYDKQNHGMVPLRTALAQSYNLATVRLGLDLGLHEVLQIIKATGIERKIPAYPSTLLGSVDMTPLEVAQMYQTFASGGFRMPLRVIREVLSADGEPLKRYGITVKQVFEPAPIYLLNTALQSVVRSGTAYAAAQRFGDIGLAGKTGTTDDLRDSWFAGFDEERLAVVWIGRDDNKPAGLSGATGALPVWMDAMARIGPRPLTLAAPPEIVWAWVDPVTQQRADGCEGALQIPFIAGYEPQEIAPCATAGDGESGGGGLDWLKGLFQ